MSYDLLSLLWPLLPTLFLRVRLVRLGDSGCCMEGLRKVPVGHRTVGEESGERCVEQQLARDCAHYSWALGDACSYLPPPCLTLAGMGEKAWVPGRLSSPSHWLGAAEVVAKACVGLCVCMCPRVRAYTHVCRGGSSSGREGM